MMEIKAWKCGNGHALGQVQRNGSGIPMLALYRQALDLEDPGEPPDVMACLEGYAMDVRCSICGEMRTWYPEAEAMEELMRKVGRIPNPQPLPFTPEERGQVEGGQESPG